MIMMQACTMYTNHSNNKVLSTSCQHRLSSNLAWPRRCNPRVQSMGIEVGGRCPPRYAQQVMDQSNDHYQKRYKSLA